MIIRPENNNEIQHALIPATVLEKLVTQLLVHNERESLRESFIELVDEFFSPESIKLFSSGLRGIVAHRNMLIADIMVSDLLDSNTVAISLSDDEHLHHVADKAEVRAVNVSQSKIELYIPLMQGNIVGTVLVLKNVSPMMVEDFIWQHTLMAYNNLNRMLYSAEIDPLTGLMNRLAFDRLLTRQSKVDTEVASDEKNTYFALLDIDFFKKINDNFGHLYGDEVLILLARAMSESFRSMDWLFRYGGEEFAIVLIDVSQEEAHEVLERFRHKIEMMDFPQVGQVTLSVGFSRMVNLEPVSSLIDRADNALYYAKNHGRNQVLFYEALRDEGLLNEVAQEMSDIELF